MEFASDRHKWEQQPDEPDQEFRHFEVYRLMGPKRSIQKAVTLEKGRDPSKVRHEGFNGPRAQLAAQWKWFDRASAWDAYEYGRLAAELAEERRQEKINRIQTLKALRGRLIEAMDALRPEDAKWQDVISGVKSVHQELRLELGSDSDDSGTEQPGDEQHAGTAKDKLGRLLARPAAGRPPGGDSKPDGSGSG